MTEILSPADTRINFIPTKKPGNCQAARTKDFLRSLLNPIQKAHEGKPCLLQLANWWL